MIDSVRHLPEKKEVELGEPAFIRGATQMLRGVNRLQDHPLILPDDVAPSIPNAKVRCVLNPGAFRFQNKTWLLLRVAEGFEESSEEISAIICDPRSENGITTLNIRKDNIELNILDSRGFVYKGTTYSTTCSHLRLASSEDNIHFTISDYPTILGANELEEFGIEDARVTFIDDRFYITYTAVSRYGFGVGLTSTVDWQTFTEHKMILPPYNKDCALFPQKINGKYMALHRPTVLDPATSSRHIWITTSTDLVQWGEHRCLLSARPDMWDSKRIGAGDSPHWTPKGWLEIYHGVDEFDQYCLGAVLLKHDDPSRVLARSRYPILEPTEEYERKGFFGKVVFTNGTLLEEDSVLIYYGAADTVVCGARIALDTIFNTLEYYE
jgi:beta-1,2-mannobiose phosphorylase / 1,2-beta-oligomannan phosphorylase